MQSPLEPEPALIAGVGLITVRWALLESVLSDVLGSLLLAQDGDPAYYAMGAFSQRLAMVRGALRASILQPLHRRIADAILDRVAELWKARNSLIHSHYVYREWVPDTSKPRKPVRKAYCYEHRGNDGQMTYVPVNKGTFLNHAEKVSKGAVKFSGSASPFRWDTSR